MRNKSEPSKLGDQEDLNRLTAELEVVPFEQNYDDVKKKHKMAFLYMSIGGPKFLGDGDLSSLTHQSASFSLMM